MELLCELEQGGSNLTQGSSQGSRTCTRLQNPLASWTRSLEECATCTTVPGSCGVRSVRCTYGPQTTGLSEPEEPPPQTRGLFYLNRAGGIQPTLPFEFLRV